MTRQRILVLVTAACIALAGPATAQESVGKASLGHKRVFNTPPPAGGVNCPISCGHSGTHVLGDLSDCAVSEDNGAWRENRFSFTGDFGQVIRVTMTSDDFDAYLKLYKDGEVVAFDDDSAGNLNALLDTGLFDGIYTLGAGHFAEGAAGTFNLTVQCLPAPASRPFRVDPQYPDFLYRAVIQPPGQGGISAVPEFCLQDTICLSGAVFGRSEVFIRILGPRGPQNNQFLWPTIVRFTPSRVLVEMVQQSTGAVQEYILELVPPADENLSGRQDRQGFRP